MNYVYAGLVAVAFLALYLHQDGWLSCNDGVRYTSGQRQPSPFHRRFCGWPKALLGTLSLGCMGYLGLLMGSWQKAAIFMSLPGAWFVVTHPTTVDAPSMLLAWLSGLYAPDHPVFAVFLSMVSGFIHERGPVFAALYGWSPWPLLGLVASGWWRRPAEPDDDQLVGRGIMHTIQSHRPYVDFLDWRINAFALRGALFGAAYFGAPPQAWAAACVANLSRLVGTDASRFLLWAAPPLIVSMPDDIPVWMVAAHLVTFRRMI